MPSSPYPSICAQAEFLTYLVVSQLTKRHLTGSWLTVEHVVESTHLWLSVNADGFDLLQRVRLANRAQDLAAHVMRSSATTFDSKTLGGAFLDHLHLDYQSLVVLEIYSACVAHIALERSSAGRRVQRDRQ